MWVCVCMRERESSAMLSSLRPCPRCRCRSGSCVCIGSGRNVETHHPLPFLLPPPLHQIDQSRSAVLKEGWTEKQTQTETGRNNNVIIITARSQTVTHMHSVFGYYVAHN